MGGAVGTMGREPPRVARATVDFARAEAARSHRLRLSPIASKQEPMDHSTLAPQPRRRVRRRAPIGLAIAAAMLVVASLPSVALAWTDYSFSSTDETLMITLINQARASAGL